MRQIAALSLVLVLAGCVSNPVYERVDGRRVTGDAALERQGRVDLTVCQGVVQRELRNLVSGAAVDDVRDGCMAERGYLRRP